MADIELVIKLSEEEYKIIKNYTAPMTWAEHLIKSGTPLPKGHGRLGDLDTLEALIKDEILRHDLNEYGCLHLVKHTPTIIEANIENEE